MTPEEKIAQSLVDLRNALVKQCLADYLILDIVRAATPTITAHYLRGQ